ncbi:alpha/beta hydrolase-fold protein [Sinomonas notoginsengisoli]|uniref:alpha/beta hydrolase n=1 Tax=Sinomonas notoginsengisoli TaxID=1457311 RepID=UPI001EE9D797|nr:alpha/beta hydrolase-fold protein [Sinomonas notoginsengisoli]
MDFLLGLEIVDGPLVLGTLVIACVFVAVLLAARTTRWRLLRLLIAASGGALVAFAFTVVWNAVGAFDLYLPAGIVRRLMGTGAALGAVIACFWDPPLWRKVLAAVAIPVVALAGGIQVNSYFGLDRTVGALFGVTTGQTIDVGSVAKGEEPDREKKLYEWTPPAGMPAGGRRGSVEIPSSGFAARKAALYLPPAALVPEPPRLPLLVFMMGYPGTPDVTAMADFLDEFARQHHGLAPIVVVADQVGTKGDPTCADSIAHGPAESYILNDVVPWARHALNVFGDSAHTAIGGYSNGGACAFKFVATRPDLFSGLAAVSPEEFPGAESPGPALRDVFRGDQKAFDAAKPASILALHPGSYGHVTAVFTSGDQDPTFAPGVERAAKAAEAAGMHVAYRVVPGAGHVKGALEGGIRPVFDILYPALELSPPRIGR